MTNPIDTTPVSTTRIDTAYKKLLVTTAVYCSSVKKNIVKKIPLKNITDEMVQLLFQKHACLSCHSTDRKLVGPSYREIAKRKYAVAQIVEYIQKPNPAHWPDYPTPMPPMAHVPKSELTKIAQW